MGNTIERARFWADFICTKCQFPAPARLRAQFAHARFSEFCECGCNSFKVEVAETADVEPIALGESYGTVFEANPPERFGEDIGNSSLLRQSGNLEYVEIDCCANSFPVPEEVSVAEPPFHVHANAALVL
jgi:hypothetical protein